MEEEKKEEKPVSSKTSAKINTGAFIRQVAVAGKHTDMQAPMPTDVQTSMQVDLEADMENGMEEDKPKESMKKKKTPAMGIDYTTVFLARNELSNRQGLYIDKEHYEVLQTLVRSIRSERLSVSGLVDNIIKHHIEQYGDDINRIFEENIRKPIKRKSDE